MDRNRVKEKLWITLMVLVFAGGCYVWNLPCIIKSLTGVSCPGCGMTQAFLAAIRLDFATAFAHHKMFWSLPVLYLCFLKDGTLFSARWANAMVYVGLLAGFLWNWLI